MAGLSSAGLGSGLDINGLITKLMAVEQQPLLKLQKDEASYQAKLSAYGSLQGYLSNFQTAARGLNTRSTFNTQKATPSDTTVISASAASNAAAGSYSINVSTLAQNQKLRSGTAYASATSSVGTGTLTIDFGKYAGGTFSQNSAKGTKTITVGSGQDSLSGVRDAINAANAGVSATIVNDGSGYRLLLTSNDSGASNALRITTSGSLSALAYDASTGGTSNMVQTQAAQDASFTIDNIAMTRSSNTVGDAIEGVTLNLLKGGGAATTLAVSRDTSGVRSAVAGFVKGFNDLSKSLKDLTAYDAEKKQAAILQGDSTTNSIRSQLRGVLNTSLTYANGGVKTLSDIGVSFQKDGSLSLDYSKLDAVLADSSKDVSTLFAAIGKPTDSLLSFSASTKDTLPGNHAVRITQLAAQGYASGAAAQGTQTTIDGSNNTLTVAVNGVAVSVALANGTYSNAGLLAMLQAAINGSAALSGSGIAVTASMNGTQGTVAGSAAAGLTIDGTNNAIDVTIDGTTVSGAITLSNGTYTADALASEVQSKINTNATFAAAGLSVTVTNTNGVLTFKSNRYGATSGVTIAGTSGGAGATNLLGSAPTTTAGSGTSTITLTSNQYGSVSNVNISGGTGAITLFGGTGVVTGTAGKDVAGSVFNTAGLTRGQATASIALSGSQTVDGTNNGLSVTVDGTIADLTLAAGTYTPAQLAAEIQGRINADTGLAAAGISVAASLDSSGKLVITSNNYGTTSSVSVTGGTAATAFIGTAVSVAGTGTPTGTATGFGQALTAATGDAKGMVVTVSGGAIGSRGTIAYEQGFAYRLDQTIDGMLDTSGTIASRTDGINRSVQDIARRREVLNRRLTDIEARYRKQFNALDSLVAGMQQTSQYLTQQLSALSSSTK